MSIDTKGKKRKSGDDVTTKVSKKVRTIKPVAQPAPLKSALKKTKAPVSDTTDAAPKKPSKTSKAETKTVTKKSNGKLVRASTSQTLLPSRDSDPDSDEPTADLGADQTAALIAGFSSDDDSDPEDAEPPSQGLDISTLPSAPSAAAAALPDPETTPGVLYLSRLPHGFAESQLKGYFGQFGTVSRLRLARNRRTGAARHHAFVEFASSAVADIAARTMDKYLLFGHILQARVIPADQVKDNMWIQGKKPSRPTPRNRIERGRLGRPMERDAWGRRVLKEGKRRARKGEELRELGYEFEMPALKGVEEVKVGEGEKGKIGGKGEGEVAVEETVTLQSEPEGTTVMEKKVTKKIEKKRKVSATDTVAKGKKGGEKRVKA